MQLISFSEGRCSFRWWPGGLVTTYCLLEEAWATLENWWATFDFLWERSWGILRRSISHAVVLETNEWPWSNIPDPKQCFAPQVCESKTTGGRNLLWSSKYQLNCCACSEQSRLGVCDSKVAFNLQGEHSPICQCLESQTRYTNSLFSELNRMSFCTRSLEKCEGCQWVVYIRGT